MAVVLKHKVNVKMGEGGVTVGTLSGVYSRRGVYGACGCICTQHTNAGGGGGTGACTCGSGRGPAAGRCRAERRRRGAGPWPGRAQYESIIDDYSIINQYIDQNLISALNKRKGKCEVSRGIRVCQGTQI